MRRRPYEKYLDKGLKGWVVDMARRHYWRVSNFYELDDLIADGYLAFAICKQRYGHRVQNKAHFMSLFKRVYLSMIHDHASKRTKREAAGVGEVSISQIAVQGRELQALEFLAGGIKGEAEFNLMLSEAPETVKALVIAATSGLLHRKRLPDRDSHGRFAKTLGRKETNNEFFNRVLGYHGVDFEAEFRQAFALG